MKLFAALLIVFVVAAEGIFSDHNELELKILSTDEFPSNPKECVEYVANITGIRGITETAINQCYNGGFRRNKANCADLQCQNNCLLPTLDSNGCRVSCECRKSGLWGDIMLTESNVEAVESGYANRAGYRYGGKWDNMRTMKNGRVVNNIYYTFHSSLSRSAKSAIKAALNQLNQDTDGCFEYKYTYPEYNGPYVEFFADDGCYSYVGRTVDHGKQQISIGYGCELKGIVMHEVMHSLGFDHEQSRPDRDDYVEIHWENIERENHDQFELLPRWYVNSFGSSYDINSIMQYGGYDFSIKYKVLPTITIKGTNTPVSGQREYYTKEDVYQIKSMYKC